MRLALLFSIVCLAVAGYAGATSFGSSVPGALTEGQTVAADPSTMVDTARSVTLIDQGKAALCKTTISGVTFYANKLAYAGGYWDKGIGALKLGQFLSTDKATFDTAGNALMLTTISGKKFCLNRAKYRIGKWATAFAALAKVRAYLVANPATDGPSIVVK